MRNRSFNSFWIFILLVGSIILAPPSVNAESKIEGPRFALIIGNAAYSHFPTLRNPANDAKAINDELQKLGFKTTLLLDADQPKMESAIDKFGRTLKQGGIGLFYYAGHGIQYQNQNYLIPANAQIQSSKNLRYKSVNLGQVLDSMASGNSSVNIVIIDACRNNPLPSESRSATRGLARVESSKGTLIAYATSPGKTAEDGQGRNGTYTKYLLKALQVQDIPIEITFRRVREGVDKETRGTQTPWESSSIVGEFVINPSTMAKSIRPVIPAKVDKAEQALEAEKLRMEGMLDNQSSPNEAIGTGDNNEQTCGETRNLSPSCVELGDKYLLQGDQYNPKLAMNAYQRACKTDENMEGCEKLGLTYASKHGNWNLTEADKYFSLACDAGSDDSCEYKKQVSMLSNNMKLCENNQYDSCTLLGKVYITKIENESKISFNQALRLARFVKTDDTKAFSYLNKACNGSQQYEACFFLANFYRLGQGTQTDYAKALRFYRRYCNGEMEAPDKSKNNEYLSCFYIGEMYRKGLGVEKDVKQAYRYYDMGCGDKQGAAVACEAMNAIKQ